MEYRIYFLISTYLYVLEFLKVIWYLVRAETGRGKRKVRNPMFGLGGVLMVVAVSGAALGGIMLAVRGVRMHGRERAEVNIPEM